MLRRDFLKLSGIFTFAIQNPFGVTGCGARNARAAKGQLAFLHGVASGDPRESSVVLWTRVTPLEDNSGYVDVGVQIASNESFTDIVAETNVRIDESSDYTLRFLITELNGDTIYYYRFIVRENVVSTVGRTWTAPTSNSNTTINFASVNCQNREHGFYSAYTQMLQEDLQKARDDQIRFVLHVGDFIYETRNDNLQHPMDEQSNLISLRDAYGELRSIDSFPDGGSLSDGSQYAVSVNDYRHLYKTYLLDSELQAARAHWPFVVIWDDHEFSDDCWQTEANYDDIGTDSSINEPSQARKVAANQAWFEYIPVNFTEDKYFPDDFHEAKTFVKTKVGNSTNDAYDDYGLASNDDNLKAIDSLSIYRALRFGKNLQLVLTDCRSYRSDHAVPEEISGNFPGFVHARIALPLELVNILDAGSEANNGQPSQLLSLPPILNPNINRAPGSMLGRQQKVWWKNILKDSEAKWKVWGSSVPLMRLGVDLSALQMDLEDIVISSDTWDGYNTERKELMNYLNEQNISNVVSITGDVHAFYMGEVYSDYDIVPQQASYSIPEFVCGAISSVNQFQALDQLSFRDNPDATEEALRRLIVFEDKNSHAKVNNFNNTMLRGVTTAFSTAQEADTSAAVANTVAPMNSHLRFADTNAHGYGLFAVSETSLNAEFVVVDNIINDPRISQPTVLRRTQFSVAAQEANVSSEIIGPLITGEPPYPL